MSNPSSGRAYGLNSCRLAWPMHSRESTTLSALRHIQWDTFNFEDTNETSVIHFQLKEDLAVSLHAA